MIEPLASLRSRDKVEALNNHIKTVSEFIELKEEMMRFTLGGGNSEEVNDWILLAFGERRVLMGLLEMEGERIQAKIRQTAKLVFSKSESNKTA